MKTKIIIISATVLSIIVVAGMCRQYYGRVHSKGFEISGYNKRSALYRPSNNNIDEMTKCKKAFTTVKVRNNPAYNIKNYTNEITFSNFVFEYYTLTDNIYFSFYVVVKDNICETKYSFQQNGFNQTININISDNQCYLLRYLEKEIQRHPWNSEDKYAFFVKENMCKHIEYNNYGGNYRYNHVEAFYNTGILNCYLFGGITEKEAEQHEKCLFLDELSEFGITYLLDNEGVNYSIYR